MTEPPIPGGTLIPAGDDLTSDHFIAEHLVRLLPASHGSDGNPAAAIIPWFCDRLPSGQSRRAYLKDLSAFSSHMRGLGLDPLAVSGDTLRIYKAAMREAGMSTATIARRLSVLRGVYEQFAKRGLLPWETVRDIQSVESPRVEKNTTPALSETEARRLLHAPDRSTLQGIRDHAMLFVFFKTACRCGAVVKSRVGDIERTDTDYHLIVSEKGGKRQRKALLEAAPAVLAWIDAARIREDADGPLFRPISRDRQVALRRPLYSATIWYLVRRYAKQVGIDATSFGGRSICTHSLRKTAITNAIQHGAKLEQAQALAGHADIRTTQLYFQPQGTEAEEAARHIQIR